MNRKKSMSWGLTLVLSGIVLPPITVCNSDAPITAEPTRTIEPALLGQWTSVHSDVAGTALRAVTLDPAMTRDSATQC